MMEIFSDETKSTCKYTPFLSPRYSFVGVVESKFGIPKAFWQRSHQFDLFKSLVEVINLWLFCFIMIDLDFVPNA